jgi:hypothetical protein
MPAHEVILDIGRGDPYEWGALLVTLLAFPEKDAPETLMESCFYSLCSFAIRGRMAHDPAWAYQKQPIKPIYACRDVKRLEHDIRHIEKRLMHRMLAGKMCIPFLKEVEMGATPELPPGVERLNISQVANTVLRESRNNEPKNVVSRIWRQSLPVIHLAAAITIISSECVRLGQGPLTVAHLVVDPSAIKWVVRRAEEYIPLLAKSRRAHVDVESLLRIRLAA